LHSKLRHRLAVWSNHYFLKIEFVLILNIFRWF
jgi:hypothetical protein